MKSLNNRNQFADLLNELGLTGEAVEVGTAEGYFSHYLLDRWPGTLTQIDPWRILDTPGFSGHGEETDAKQEARYQRMVRAATKYNGRCKVLRATSEEAVSRFEDESLDMVYIDADHSLEAARQDIALWSQKVKAHGILAGHDYLSGLFNGQQYGVKDAVLEFATKNNLTVNVTEEKDWPSFWIQMP